ncbi:hypothetical protein Ahy_A09g043832 [Arachis hypogaea]|uniref:Uncharacterized protein n=1 Tax=Arachis hypogaea TaxID=3818 RepID=A0A445BJ20_ARAHY|nr:hypothetical protein Ahy_A09g043832 [Arachis hypogaea]
MARDQTSYRTSSPPPFANMENMEEDEDTPVTRRELARVPRGRSVLKSVDAVMRKMSLPKWAPKWEGPYIVSEIHSNGHCILLDPDHGTTTSPINFKYVKKYYA